MRCSLIYAEPGEQLLLQLDLPANATVAAALAAAARELGRALPAHMAVGIFGEIVSLEQNLQDGDRLELYRPLTIDPKESRRARAQRLRRGR